MNVLANPDKRIFCDSGEIVGSYGEYLKTRHWRKIKNEAYQYWGKSCVQCGETKNLNMHHLTYYRIGRENVYMDVCPLCRKCHIEEHMAHPTSRKFLESAEEFGALGDTVQYRALSKINDKWLETEMNAGKEMHTWFEAEKDDILKLIRNNHYNAINHNLQERYGEVGYIYIYNEPWFQEMMIRKGVSGGFIRKQSKREMIKSVYQKKAIRELLNTKKKKKA